MARRTGSAALARRCSWSDRSWRESTRVHSGVDRLDADGTRVLGQESTIPASTPPLKKHLHRTAPLQWRSSSPSATEMARSNEEDHARHCTIARRTPIRGNGRGKSRCLQASNRPPLPKVSSRRTPDSAPLTFGARFLSESLAAAWEIYVSTKKKNLRTKRGPMSLTRHWSCSPSAAPTLGDETGGAWVLGCVAVGPRSIVTLVQLSPNWSWTRHRAP